MGKEVNPYKMAHVGKFRRELQANQLLGSMPDQDPPVA
jgi:hypothetical protein